MNVTQEDYLKSILNIEMSGQQATVSTLSNMLHVKPSSVTEMVKKLSELDLLLYKKYKGFKLSPKGKTLALKILRRHRLWETFLYNVLNYPWSDLHGEAEKFEHLISSNMESRIDELLNYPAFDPHGHPIPQKDGLLPLNERVKFYHVLSQVEIGGQGTLVQVSDDSVSFLDYLEQIDLSIGDLITVKDKRNFDNAMEITFKHKTLLLTRQMADNIIIDVQST
ncbi:MAG: metal-dependent transcriptional regulator [Caldithrix sp.]|nr:metal-dependent transcriptional regulator [Caldithrix sp.]